ncbi:hypothetical protein [Methylocaldum sp.]|uniref:hypothetical protein n=1 Tax=Methylocaldum sp. TaxID=1969727 RepID=UPI002D66CC6A|nr:hypothetical protein [Methylocaldum sp.]HYE38129.1 hypothetical protein [Methylocaldum sp.]
MKILATMLIAAIAILFYLMVNRPDLQHVTDACLKQSYFDICMFREGATPELCEAAAKSASLRPKHSVMPTCIEVTE